MRLKNINKLSMKKVNEMKQHKENIDQKVNELKEVKKTSR